MESLFETKASGNLEKEPNFPDEWVAIAAYYSWKNDGQPEGKDADYWVGPELS